MIQYRNTVWLQLSYGTYFEKHVINKSAQDDSDLDDFDYQGMQITPWMSIKN
jgi:hypothetical protein